MAQKIKIATYNICHGLNYEKADSGDRKSLKIDLKRTADTIVSTGAEIVSLNEVYGRGPFKLNRQEKKLARYSCFRYSKFGKAISFGKIFAKIHYGNALISKHPIISSSAVPVPAPAKPERRADETKLYEDRNILVSLLNVNNTSLTVMNTHFGLNLKEQENMVAKLVEIIENCQTPVILMGDFNVTPHTEVLAPLYEHLKSAADECDAYDFTFSTYNPHIVIDYIFVSKDIRVLDYTVVKSKVSDHFPCVVTLEI